MTTTPSDARRALLDVIKAKSAGHAFFDRWTVIASAVQTLGQPHDSRNVRLAMDAFDDLVVQRLVSYGGDFANHGMDRAHLTDHGRETVADLDSDPANEKSYLALVEPHLATEPIAMSYLRESVATYNRGLHKAAAVMLGCASEALSLSLRDAVVDKLKSSGGKPLADLTDWRMARVLSAMEREFDARKGTMGPKLKERFGAFWSAWTGLFRMTRNEVGHPSSVDPVTREIVRGSLLFFPSHGALVVELHEWVASTF